MRRVFLVIIALLICVDIYAFRASRPPKLIHPLDDGQINQLNEFLENIWYVQNGLIDLDIVTTSKMSARNGEIWIVWTAPVARIQYKARDTIFTITPDGY